MWPEFRILSFLKRTFLVKVYPHQTTFLVVTVIAVVGFALLWYRLPNSPATVLRLQVLQLPSRLLPYQYWEHRHRYPENYNQISCSHFPQLDELHYAAASWQHLPVENGSVYVYSAYWDDRFQESIVRVLVYCDVTPLPTMVCQLWYENDNAPISVPSDIIYGWNKDWGGPTNGVNEPYILGCRARRHPPDKQVAPVAVSIARVGTLCDTPTNVLNIQGAHRPNKNQTIDTNTNIKISVCLKWLQYWDDVSAELTEWIEMIRALGADKLFIFVVKAHPNTRRVLEYYKETGFADVTEFVHPPQLRSTFSPSDENFHDFRRELLPLNDCLYRSIHEYQWLAAIDLDEIIVPQRVDIETWQDIIDMETDAGQTNIAAITFRNYYFLDPAQRDLAAAPYMRILGHLWRAMEPNEPGTKVKSFHNTSSVLAMHNHYPMTCEGPCWIVDIDSSVARLHHYRSHCGDEPYCPELRNIVRDNITHRWRHVMKEVDRVLTTLGIFPDDHITTLYRSQKKYKLRTAV